MAGIPTQPPTPHLITVANPAAGSDWQYIVPANTILRIITVHWSFVASGLASNRLMTFMIDDGAVAWYYSTTSTKIVAGVTAFPTFGVGQGFQTAGAIVRLNIPLADRLFVPAGYRLGSSIEGILIGDQISAIRVKVERYVS